MLISQPFMNRKVSNLLHNISMYYAIGKCSYKCCAWHSLHLYDAQSGSIWMFDINFCQLWATIFGRYNEKLYCWDYLGLYWVTTNTWKRFQPFWNILGVIGQGSKLDKNNYDRKNVNIQTSGWSCGQYTKIMILLPDDQTPNSYHQTKNQRCVSNSFGDMIF
jgi:hypothetical protein